MAEEAFEKARELSADLAKDIAKDVVKEPLEALVLAGVAPPIIAILRKWPGNRFAKLAADRIDKLVAKEAESPNELLSESIVIATTGGAVHASRVTSETARTLIIHTAPGYERVVRAAGTAVSEPGLPPADWRQEGSSPERLKEIQADIGLRTIVVPSGFQV